MKLIVVDDIPVLGELKHLFLSVTDRCYRTEYLLSLYQDNQLPAKLSKEVEDHLSVCASCKAALAIMSASQRVLASRPMVEPPTYLSERLRQAIALEATKPAPVTPKASPLYGRLALAGGTFAAAAVFAAFLLNHATSHTPALAPGHAVVATTIGTSPNSSTVPITPMHRLGKNARIKHSEEELLASLPSHVSDHSPTIASEHLASIEAHYRLNQNVRTGHATIGGNTEIAKLIPPANKHTVTTTSIVVASVPPRSVLDTGTTAQSQPASITTPPTSQSSSPVVVADNIGQDTHVILDNRLKTIALSIRMPLTGQIQPDRNEVQIASYSPGVQITGSGIDH